MNQPSLEIIRNVKGLRTQVHAWKQAGLTVGMIPTMGALHEGHLSLVKEMQKLTDKTVVSIFVNPTQFGVNEDLDKYPRQEAADSAKLTEIGTDLLFAPTVSEIYPDGFRTTVHVADLGDMLCGKSRPGHFDGVSTVVSKLLLQCLPDKAIFGEKDYQQLAIIRQTVRDLNIPTEVVGGKLIRDEDGLALSSRNAYMSDAERQTALAINRTLSEMVDMLENQNKSVAETLAHGHAQLNAAGFDEIQYLDIRDAMTLAEVAEINAPARILTAVKLGQTRLIDNMGVDAG